MTAEALPDQELYYCIICGPRFSEELDNGNRLIQHADVYHPECVYYTDEEANPQ